MIAIQICQDYFLHVIHVLNVAGVNHKLQGKSTWFSSLFCRWLNCNDNDDDDDENMTMTTTMTM